MMAFLSSFSFSLSFPLSSFPNLQRTLQRFQAAVAVTTTRHHRRCHPSPAVQVFSCSGGRTRVSGHCCYFCWSPLSSAAVADTASAACDNICWRIINWVPHLLFLLFCWYKVICWCWFWPEMSSSSRRTTASQISFASACPKMKATTTTTVSCFVPILFFCFCLFCRILFWSHSVQHSKAVD